MKLRDLRKSEIDCVHEQFSGGLLTPYEQSKKVEAILARPITEHEKLLAEVIGLRSQLDNYQSFIIQYGLEQEWETYLQE